MKMKLNNKIYFFIFAVFTIELTGCFQNIETAGFDDNDSTAKIIGGSPVIQSDPISKSAVMLLNSETSEVCTATIIAVSNIDKSSGALLTAGHCVPKEIENLSVYFDPNPFSDSSNAESANVEKIFVHDQYQSKQLDSVDLAIIFLNKKIPPGYTAINITEDSPPKLNEAIHLAGYGNSSAIESEGFGVLRKVTNIISSVSEDFIEVNQTNGKGICDGDSGGPALIKRNGEYVLVGVSKLTYDKDNTGAPSCLNVSKFTAIKKYQDWIIKTLLKKEGFLQ